MRALFWRERGRGAASAAAQETQARTARRLQARLLCAPRQTQVVRVGSAPCGSRIDADEAGDDAGSCSGLSRDSLHQPLLSCRAAAGHVASNPSNRMDHAARARLRFAAALAASGAALGAVSLLLRRRRRRAEESEPWELDVRSGVTTRADPAAPPKNWAFLSCGRVAHDYANALKCVDGAALFPRPSEKSCLMSFKRTTPAFQRCKNRSKRCSRGRDRAPRLRDLRRAFPNGRVPERVRCFRRVPERARLRRPFRT